MSSINDALATGTNPSENLWKKSSLSSLREIMKTCYTNKLLKQHQILPIYKLKKQEIVDLLKTRISQIKPLIRIQALVRRFMVRCYIFYRGPGLLKRNQCANETDFASLEPIQEINHFYYFGVEESGSIYAFDICSILRMIVKSKQYDFETMKNPYTRTPFLFADRFMKLIQFIYLIFKDKTSIHEFDKILKDLPYYHELSIRHMTETSVQAPAPTVNEDTDGTDDFNPTLYTPEERSPRYVFEHSYRFIRDNVASMNFNFYYSFVEFYLRANVDRIDHQYSAILSKRNSPIQTRIRELFMEIDSYGHITDPTWLSSLTIDNLAVLIQCLNYLWNRISYSSKIRISPISPITVYMMSDVNFNYVYIPRHQQIDMMNGVLRYIDSENDSLVWRDTESVVTNYDPRNSTVEQHVELELYHKMKYIMNFAECFVCAGYTREDRDLGIVNFLSALSEVSEPCRNAMPWVHQNLAGTAYQI